MRSLPARTLIRTLTVAFVILAARRFVWMPWYANHALSEVEARSRAALNSGDAVATAILARRNIDELQRIAPATRDDANYYMLYAANAGFLNDLDLAARLYTDALSNADHRPEIYYERGLIYLRLGEIEAAVADLAHAARFNPYIVDSLSGELQDRVKREAGLR